ncbi:MAG: BMP family ABC transporter substrate-binding protein [Treponema sp.]|nr:BMP family ABC transporter substrate-binding protein [Treponema sp.]
MACVLSVSCQRKVETPSDGRITVRLLTDSSGVDDKSFNAAAWKGILQFYGDTSGRTRQTGGAYDWISTQNQSMYVPALRQATDEGYDLIIVNGFTWDEALTQVSNDNPNQKYLIVDVDWVEAGSVMQAAYAEHEGSFLVGAAAALKYLEDREINPGITPDVPRFGFIGGMAGAVITKFEVGYAQGILSVIPDAQIVDYYVGSWSEPALAKIQAMNWFDTGVYAIFSAAGNSGNGAIAQASEYRMAGRNVWAIGVDSDQFEEGLYNASESSVLTSMLKRVENSVLYALNAVNNNTFTSKVITFDLKADGVGYSDANPALGRNIINQLEQIKQRISSGQITVAATLAEAMRLQGFPQNLRAIDD